MDITFKGLGITTTLYWAPTISYRGWIAAWKGQHSDWKHGFVIRFLWLGYLLRWGKIKRNNFRRQFENMIAQADDGDYFADYLNEAPH
jgi:hypothetical protein